VPVYVVVTVGAGTLPASSPFRICDLGSRGVGIGGANVHDVGRTVAG
jgi:hypothetical protein